MNPPSLNRLAMLLAFAAVLLLSATVREIGNHVGAQAVIWLPTGIGIAGLWLLGWSSAWVIAATTIAQRLLLGYDLTVALPAAAGSLAEAAIGVLILQRFRVRAPLNRLRDVMALFMTAGIAPLGSILFSWLGRAVLWGDPHMAFYSGWDGWWRMNALGALAVVPVALPWLGVPRRHLSPRFFGTAVGLGLITALPLYVAMRFTPHGITGVLLLDLVLPVALLAALRYGQGGAAAVGALSAIVVAMATADGIGPFEALPLADRHTALQIYELSVVTLPLVIGALVSERHAALVSSLESRELLASINLNISEGLFRITPAGDLLYANGAFRRIFGLPESDAAAESPLSRTVSTNLAAELASAREGLTNAELELRRADGSAFWALVSETPVHDVTGAVVHIDGAIADITAHKGLEAEFRQAQKMEAVGKLAGGVAHDFNNLLTAIFGFAESIQSEPGATPRIVTLADDVLKAARRAAGLTRQLLAYSRQQVLSPQVLEIAPALERLTTMLERLIGEQIELSILHAEPRARVRVDLGQLEQAVMNLVVNARDAMPNGGSITITTGTRKVPSDGAQATRELPPGTYVTIAVRDTGEGMTPEVAARAFDPFFTTKAAGKGTGLGLSMVYGIVKQSGGATWIDSKPNGGTTVWICLPLVDAPVDPVRRPEPARSLERHATILLVEDEHDVRELVGVSLRDAGFLVLEARNGIEAIDRSRVHNGDIDLLLTDVVMPRLGGPELAQRLRGERPALKVLMMSGYTNDLVDMPGRTITDAAFIAKPFTSAELKRRVWELLAGVEPGPA